MPGPPWPSDWAGDSDGTSTWLHAKRRRVRSKSDRREASYVQAEERRGCCRGRSSSTHLRPGWVLVANRHSLISSGTERSKIEMGERAWSEGSVSSGSRAEGGGQGARRGCCSGDLGGPRPPGRLVSDRLLVGGNRSGARRWSRRVQSSATASPRRRGLGQSRRDHRRAEEPGRTRSPTTSISRTRRTRPSARSRCMAPHRARRPLGNASA